MKALKSIAMVFVALILIGGVFFAKDVVDNGWEDSRLNELVAKFQEKKDSGIEVTSITPVTQQKSTTATTEMSYSEFLREAQNNAYGALNAPYDGATVTDVKLTDADGLMNKYVMFNVCNSKFSVMIQGKTFNLSVGDAKCTTLKIEVCKDHADSMKNSISQDGRKVAIKMDKDFLENLQSVACTWKDKEGNVVYGVRVCETTTTKVSSSGGNGGGSGSGGGSDPTTPDPTDPDPVLPDPDPVLPPVEDDDDDQGGEPEHSPQDDNPVVEEATPEKQEELDKDEGEFWTTDDMPISDPKHSPQDTGAEPSATADEQPAHSAPVDDTPVLPQVTTVAVASENANTQETVVPTLPTVVETVSETSVTAPETTVAASDTTATAPSHSVASSDVMPVLPPVIDD